MRKTNSGICQMNWSKLRNEELVFRRTAVNFHAFPFFPPADKPAVLIINFNDSPDGYL